MRRFLGLWLLLSGLALPLVAQQVTPSPAPPPVTPPPTEFERAADEVLADVSKLIALPVKSPLRKSIRTREEIRQFVIREMEADRDPVKRRADRLVLERFGLIPRGFDLDGFLVELLTEQIAGLYDPKQHEFFIADWIELDEQRMVMAHELVHALHDQHFDLEKWIDAAKPDDDALLARDAVVEGAAIGGMFDYMLRDLKLTVRELPDMETVMQREFGGSFSQSPQLASAPMYIRDAIMFPYFAGTTFLQKVLRAGSGWEEFHKRVFENPPVSTQQILHPELYLAGVAPRPVSLPDLTPVLPPGYRRLDKNAVGEFGLRGILKQYLGKARAEEHSWAWAGDRYGIYEDEAGNEVALLFRLRLESVEAAARFFGQYSEVLEQKYSERSHLMRRPNFFSFEGEDGGVFLYCSGDECVTLEGADRAAFDRVVSALKWPAAPPAPARKPEKAIATLTPAFH
jgi:hypothetical protein